MQALGEVSVVPPMPAQIGKFQVLAEIGRGGMGIVYKVKTTSRGSSPR